MTALDVRRKRFGPFTDLIFMSLSSDQMTTPVGPIPTYIGFKANVKELIVDPEAYARVIDSDRGFIDVFAGGRFWKLNNKL